MEKTVKSDNLKLVYPPKLYSEFRKNTPGEVVSKIIFYLKEKYTGSLSNAVDVGCGCGQSTIVLASFFEKVYGIDNLETQIEEAKLSRALDNVIYKLGSTEHLPFKDGSVQLITASNSLHWFNLEDFFPEAKRVLCNNGILAVYGFHCLKPLFKDQEANIQMDKIYDQIQQDIDPYYKPQVQINKDKYNLSYPFEEVIRIPAIRCNFEGQLRDVIGHFETRDALYTWREQNPLEAYEKFQKFEKGLHDIANYQNISFDDTVTLYIDYFLTICRKVV